MDCWMKIFRQIQVTRMESRERLEKLYVCMEIYNKIFSSWLKYTICPAFFGGFCAAIFFLYVTFRQTSLPIFIYPTFPCGVIILMGLLVCTSYDANMVTRYSEQLCLKLRSVQTPFLNWLTKAQRSKVVKRALACRACTFPVGIFADFSLAVPIRIWEEILNLLVLLLSL